MVIALGRARGGLTCCPRAKRAGLKFELNLIVLNHLGEIHHSAGGYTTPNLPESGTRGMRGSKPAVCLSPV